MKKFFVLLFITSFVIMSCPQPVGHENTERTYNEFPTTIEVIGKDVSEGIETFETDVRVYHMNSRTDSGLKLIDTYRLTTMDSDGEKITRIDFSDDHPADFRSVIMNGDKVILFNPESEQASQKIESQASQNNAYRFLSSQSGFSKVNLSLIREEAQRLAFNINSDNERELVFSIPPNIARLPQGERRLSSRISFDVKDEVLASTETVTLMPNGSTVTVTVTPRYEKQDGVPIKTGQTTITKVDVPLISTSPYEGEIYNSPEDVPTISKAEYDRLNDQGAIHERTGMIFGNPNDLSYVETEVITYNTIKINNPSALSLRPFWQKLVHFIIDPVGATIYEIITSANNSPKPNNPPAPVEHQGYEDPQNYKPLPPGETVEGKTIFAKVSNYEQNTTGHRAYLFSGFDGANYKATNKGLSYIIHDEYNAISRGGTYTSYNSGEQKTVQKSDEPYVIVGYSEGGMRSLGYATHVKGMDEDEFNKLRGVITVSGANKGFKAMEGGIESFKYKIYNVIDIIAGGLRAINITDPSHYSTYLAVPFSSEVFLSSVFHDTGIRFILSLWPNQLGDLVGPVIRANSSDNYSSIAAIRDLVPFSAFANTYVCDAKVNVVKMKIGTYEEFKLLPFPHISSTALYEYYTYYSNEEIKFDKNLKVAYIIGTDNDSTRLAEEQFEKDIKGTINVLIDTLKVVEIYHTVVNYTLLGGGIFSDYERAKQDARKARIYLENFENNLTSLKGSNENDGFLACESMYYLCSSKKSNNCYIKENIRKCNVDCDCNCHSIISYNGEKLPRIKANHKEIINSKVTVDMINYFIKRMFEEEERQK